MINIRQQYVTLSGVLAINFKQAAITEQLVKRFLK